MPDFYPSSNDARGAWLENFATKLPTVAAKYGLFAEQTDEIANDNTWYQFWLTQRHAWDAQGQQFTKFFNAIQGADDSVPAPIEFAAVIPPPAPPPHPVQVPPGIEKRVRDLAKQIKNHPAYSPADGEMLGIVPPVSPSPSHPGGNAKPIIELTTRVQFEVGVKFRKFGMSGIRIEYRHQGGDWLPAGVLITSPGHFTVAPLQPNTPEQIEVRAVYLLGNTPTGDYSDVGSVYVGP